MYCEKCGAQIPDGSIFCPKCGAAVNRNAHVSHQYHAQKAKKINRKWIIAVIVAGITAACLVVVLVRPFDKTKNMMEQFRQTGTQEAISGWNGLPVKMADTDAFKNSQYYYFTDYETDLENMTRFSNALMTDDYQYRMTDSDYFIAGDSDSSENAVIMISQFETSKYAEEFVKEEKDLFDSFNEIVKNFGENDENIQMSVSDAEGGFVVNVSEVNDYNEYYYSFRILQNKKYALISQTYAEDSSDNFYLTAKVNDFSKNCGFSD